MSAEFFLDTNVVVYTFDASEPAKRERARALMRKALDGRRGAVSWQVVQEFANLALRKFARPLTPAACSAYLRAALFPICAVWPSPALMESALDVHALSGWHWYDSLIVASALEAGCGILYSEDLQAGRRIRGLEIRNPFA
ncbi:MAG TPA: PIN domain-containing protein [Spirochaetales bacterium]|nr:PIN domain-containing protein [Spirochaetales bacterium]